MAGEREYEESRMAATPLDRADWPKFHCEPQRGELIMRDFHRIRRLGGVLAGLASCVAAFVLAAPAAFAMLPPPDPAGDAPAPPPVLVHVTAAGGMPGWQITLIAIGAALVSAAAAVLLDRARRARRVAPVTSS
jgi:hypothetical protein